MSAAPSSLQAIRERLRPLVDQLIPAGEEMPAASEVGVADAQLDMVIAVRPDLVEPLERALQAVDPEDALASLARLESDDQPAHAALVLTVAGAYYIHPEVRSRLGYDGQQPVLVRPEIIPNYVEEGLLDGVLERGPIYRSIPEQENA